MNETMILESPTLRNELCNEAKMDGYLKELGLAREGSLPHRVKAKQAVAIFQN